MPQLHLYVPETTAAEITRRAEMAELSVSQFLAGLVRREVSSDWPDDFFKDVVGGWKGERLSRPPQGASEIRDEF